METLLRAMLALMVADRDERTLGKPPRRTEVVLAEAGLSLRDISELTGKSYDAVKKSVQRAKNSASAEMD
jgi:DNA-directed RNA polymerase specialized sigma24 family protein